MSFSRFENSSLDAANVLYLSGLPNHETLRILYVLWLGDFLARRSWDSPFSERNVSAILSANLILKKEESAPEITEARSAVRAAALRLAPDNADIRLMLAEFFVQVNLLKRAEGELSRLLAIFPGNREARVARQFAEKIVKTNHGIFP